MSNTIDNFIFNNVKCICSSDKTLKIFKYLKNNIDHNGFVFLQKTRLLIQDKKSGKMISKILCFFHMEVQILVE